jgi:serine protease
VRLAKQNIFLGAAIAALLLTATAAGAGDGPTPAGGVWAGAPAYVPGEVLVSFRGEGERLVELPDGIEVTEAARSLEANAAVSYAVPNYIARASAVPNDPGRGDDPGDWRKMQWGFLPCGSTCGQSAAPLKFESAGGINAIDAWRTLAEHDRKSGKGVKVAVLDTGVAYRNKKPAFLKSPDFARKQFLPGHDFVKGNDLPLDRNGHGTHVTGTIAERNNNGVALTGLAPAARIIPVRVLDAEGFGTTRDIARGIRFAAAHGAEVINMSFEFSSAVNSCGQIQSVCKALRFATVQHDAVAVAASGNSDGAPVAYPARAPRVIGVGRTTRDGCLADRSRTGEGLDLVAPGGGTPTVGVLDCRNDLEPDESTPIFQLTFNGPGFTGFGFPNIYEGTSMATAHVSGVAAMVISSGVLGGRPSRAAVQCQLERTARNDPDSLGQPYDPTTFGAGLIDAAAAVEARAAGC